MSSVYCLALLKERTYPFPSMKNTLTAQQIVHFRSQGHIRFENVRIDFKKIQEAASQHSSTRDVFRSSPFLKKIITQTLAPIALELMRSRALRLACDQWVDAALPEGRLADLFCFQKLVCFLLLSESAATHEEVVLDVFEPTSLTSLIPPNSYLVALGPENTILIEKKDDPFCLQTRNLGYVYGDKLRNSLHPALYRRGH